MNLRALLLGALIAGAGLAVVGCGKSDVDAKVLGFHMPAAPDDESPIDPGQVWAALEVEMCSNVSADDGVAVGHQNWVLEMPDESRISPALEVEELYMLSMDECATVKILFAVPTGAQPEAAIYSGPDDPERFSLP